MPDWLVSIQAIIDMEVQCIEDCCNVSLGTNESNSVSSEDDFSIGSCESSASRVSFNKVPEVFTYD